MTNRTLANFIRERRETLGLLPVDLANRSGLTKSEISAIEKGKIAFPGADKRRRLAEALGVRHIDLVIAAGELLAEEVPKPGAPLPRPEPPEITKILELIRWDDEVTRLVAAQLEVWVLAQRGVYLISVPTATATGSALAPQVIGGDSVKEKP